MLGRVQQATPALGTPSTEPTTEAMMAVRGPAGGPLDGSCLLLCFGCRTTDAAAVDGAADEFLTAHQAVGAATAATSAGAAQDAAAVLVCCDTIRPSIAACLESVRRTCR